MLNPVAAAFEQDLTLKQYYAAQHMLETFGYALPGCSMHRRKKWRNADQTEKRHCVVRVEGDGFLSSFCVLYRSLDDGLALGRTPMDGIGRGQLTMRSRAEILMNVYEECEATAAERPRDRPHQGRDRDRDG